MLFSSQQNPIYGTPPLFGSHEQKKKKKKTSSIILCVFVQYPQAGPSFSLRDLERLALL
jgi:hypothetical protein